LAFPVLGVIAIHLISKYFVDRLRFRLFFELFLVCSLIVVSAIVFHFVSVRGLVGCDPALLSIKPPIPSDVLIKQISESELKNDIAARSIVLVDARLPSAYSHGHIDGAINFSVDATLGELEACVARLAQEAARKDLPQGDGKIVVYCQGDQCEWDSIVAASIVQLGYKNVCLYNEGWTGWVQNGNFDQ
jgi:rhodanese-related sulfurtransferase